MAYFANHAMNLLNVHYCIRAAGQEMANLFALSYLYKQGMSLAAVCYTYTLFFSVRLVFRPLVVRLCAKKGVHFCLVAGACLFAVRYLTLIGVSGVNFWVFAFLVVSGFTEAFYWAPYHAYFGVIGAKEDRGSNIGVREAFSALISVVAPVCGGFLLNINRILAFSFSSLLILLSIYPLMLAPEIPLPKRLNRQECKACDKTGFRFFFADGIFSQPISVWPLVVFMMLSENYGEFGLILGLAAVFKAAGNMVFGRLIDCGKGLMMCYIGYGLHIAVALVRIFFARTIPVVVGCDFFIAIAYCFSLSSFMTPVYNSVKKSAHPLYFMYYAEKGWDFSGAFIMLAAGTLAHFGPDLRYILFFTIIGAAAQIALVRRYYKKSEP